MRKTYRLSISGIVFFDDEADGHIRSALENADKVSFQELEELRDVACQELQEEAGLDTIKITLEEVPSG